MREAGLTDDKLDFYQFVEITPGIAKAGGGSLSGGRRRQADDRAADARRRRRAVSLGKTGGHVCPG